MQIIKNTVVINAPKEMVWQVLTQDHYTRQWYAEFGAGSKAETSWEEGSTAKFTDNDNNGIIGVVEVNRSAEKLVIRYTGVLAKGETDYSSPYAAHVKDGYESYSLTEENGVTTLQTEASMSQEFMDMMGSAWDRAKDRIKELAENN